MAFDTVEALQLHLGKNNPRYGSLILVGAGAMGAVFSAFDNKLKRQVALKVIHSRHLNAALMKERFRREAKLLSSIRHPNVVHLFDFEDGGELCYLTEEYVEGLPLDMLIADDTLSISEIVTIISKVASALQAVHEAGVLHRDIKPSNVIIDEGKEPRLVDFGLAKSFEGTGATSLTGSGFVVGTLGFVSPEVLLGCAATEQSDVYQLGALFYSALTRKMVYDQNAILALLKGTDPSLPPKPSECNADCPEVIDELVMSCIARDPGNRPSSAGEVQKACEQWLENKDDVGLIESQTMVVEATNISVSDRLAIIPRSRAPLAVTIALLLLLLLTFLRDQQPIVLENLEIKEGAQKVEVTWRTSQKTTCSYRIRSRKSGQVIAKGIEGKPAKEHRITCSKLAPATEYSLLLQWSDKSHEASFLTSQAQLIRPVCAIFLDGTFFADYRTTLGTGARLQVIDSTGKILAERKGDGKITIEGLGRPPGNKVTWQVMAGSTILASGRTERHQPQKPKEWAFQQTPTCSPVWMKERLFIADEYGYLSCYEIGRQKTTRRTVDTYGGLARSWSFAPYTGRGTHCATVSKLSDENLFTIFRAGNRWQIWSLSPTLRRKSWRRRWGLRQSLPAWLHDLKDEWNKPLDSSEWSSFIKVPKDVILSGDVARYRNSIIIQGEGKTPYWCAVDASNGKMQWEIRGKKLLPKVLPKVKRQVKVLELDMGDSPLGKKGWGFLSSPKALHGHINSVLAFGAKINEPVSCLVASLSLDKRTVSKVSYTGYATNTYLARIDEKLSYVAVNEIRTIKPGASSSGLLLSSRRGFLGPPIKIDDRVYTVHFAPPGEKSGIVDKFIGFQKASLAVLTEGGKLHITLPPIFNEPKGAYQPTGVFAMYRWKDYLVGHTYFTVFVVNLRSGEFGSWRSFEGGVTKSALNEDGMLAAITRSGKIMLLPIDLIAAKQKGRIISGL